MREETHMVDGIRTFSRVVGEGDEVLLIHGAGVSSDYWLPAQAELAAMGPFRVWSLDLPGFGRSGDPPWPADVSRLTGHLIRWMGLAMPGACHVVGQSCGCELAVGAAAGVPERVRKVVLAAPNALPALRSVSGEILRAAVDAFREPLSLYRVILPAYLRCGPRRLLHLLLDQRHDLTEKLLPEVRQPTLVLRGSRDAIVSAGRVEGVARVMRHAVTATVPGAHGAHFSHPEEFTATVAAFLRR
ncbi:MAG TPA: alpha/beta hydrolase [Armatimonadota bacterium]|nr:alpha/beta hydrolase [Armatimonadota bacterium]